MNGGRGRKRRPQAGDAAAPERGAPCPERSFRGQRRRHVILDSAAGKDAPNGSRSDFTARILQASISNANPVRPAPARRIPYAPF